VWLDRAVTSEGWVSMLLDRAVTSEGWVSVLLDRAVTERKEGQ